MTSVRCAGFEVTAETMEVLKPMKPLLPNLRNLVVVPLTLPGARREHPYAALFLGPKIQSIYVELYFQTDSASSFIHSIKELCPSIKQLTLQGEGTVHAISDLICQ